MGIEPANQRLLEVHAVLTEAARSKSGVRVYVLDPSGPEKPLRIVEGIVVDVADGRDGRTRVRIAIPTGSGDPVEVRMLLDGIERAELVHLTPPNGMDRPRVERPIPRVSEPRLSRPNVVRTDLHPDETGPRRARKF